LQTLEKELKLKIEDYGNNKPMQSLIRSYYELLLGYVQKNGMTIFVHTRRFI